MWESKNIEKTFLKWDITEIMRSVLHKFAEIFGGIEMYNWKAVG